MKQFATLALFLGIASPVTAMERVETEKGKKSPKQGFVPEKIEELQKPIGKVDEPIDTEEVEESKKK